MHSSFFITALAATASFAAVNAHSPGNKRHASLVDIDAIAIAPILNDLEVLDLKKRDTEVDAASYDVILKNKRMEKVRRGGIEINVGIDVSVKVKALLDSTLAQLEPVFETIQQTIAKADALPVEELADTLRDAFEVVHQATGGLSGQLQTTSGGLLKRARAAKDMQERSTLNERALSDAEVAQILSLLLNKVAGVVNLAEGLVGRLPVLGPLLNPIFGLINDDLSLILSSVGNLLVGVVGLVKDLLSGVLGTVTGLPILNNLLGGLLGGGSGGLLGGIL